MDFLAWIFYSLDTSSNDRFSGEEEEEEEEGIKEKINSLQRKG